MSSKFVWPFCASSKFCMLQMLQYDNLTSGNDDVDRIMVILGWKSALGTGLRDDLDDVIISDSFSVTLPGCSTSY